MANATSPPFIVQKPLIRLGATGQFVEIQCASTNLDIAVDQDENTVETFCGSYTSYKAAKWTVTVTVGQSYGTTGVWDLVKPMVGTIVPFAISPDVGAPSATNPVMSGNCLVKAFPFISAAPGEASEVDIELAVQGTPTWGIVLPTGTLQDAETPAETPAPAAAA